MIIDPTQMGADLAAPLQAQADATQNPLAGIQPASAPATPGFVAPAATQPAPIAVPDGGADALSGNPMDVKTPLTFGQKMAQAADKLGIQSNQPGGWAKSLVGAAQDTLAGLGDASNQPVKNGGSGVLEGITETLANRQNRIREQQQDQQKSAMEAASQTRAAQAATDAHNAASVAYENSLMARDQKLAANLEGGVDASVASGKVSMEPYKAAHAEVLGEDLTANEANQILQKHPDWGHTQHAFATGKTTFGQPDANGNQKYQATYTVIGNVPEVKITADQAAYINKWLPGQNISTDPNKVQTMDGIKYGMLAQQAASAETAQLALDQARQRDDMGEASIESQKRMKAMNPDWNVALSHAPLDPESGAPDELQAMRSLAAMKNPDGTPKYPNATTDIQMARWGTTDKDGNPGGSDPTGEKGYLTEVKERAQEQKDNQKKMDDVKDNLAAAGVPFTDEMKANIAAMPDDKRKVLQAYPQDVQAILWKLMQNDGTADIDKIFPNRRYKGSQDLSLQQASNAMALLNPNWNENNYRQMQIMLKGLTSTANGTDGAKIQQYNNVLQHAADLQDTMMKSSRSSTPEFMNNSLNWLENHGYSAEVQDIIGAEEPVKDEFELLNSGGYKPSQDMKDAYNIMISKDSAPWQIYAAMKKFASTGIVRLGSINEGYKTLSGKNIPNIIHPESLDAVKHLGVEQADPEAWRRITALNSGGTFFRGPEQASIPTPEQQRQQGQAPAAVPQAKALPPVAAGLTRLTDGKGNTYDVKDATGAMKLHPELKVAQ